MTAEQFEREKHYQAAMSLARTMLTDGILTPDDMRVIDTMLRAKYRPLFGGLYPSYELLCVPNDGNIRHTEGGVKCPEM